MTFSTHYKALLRKNIISSKNSCCGTCCEILTPILFGVLIVFITENEGVEWVSEAKQVSEGKTWTLGDTNYLPLGDFFMEAVQRYAKAGWFQRCG